MSKSHRVFKAEIYRSGLRWRWVIKYRWNHSVLDSPWATYRNLQWNENQGYTFTRAAAVRRSTRQLIRLQSLMGEKVER